MSNVLNRIIDAWYSLPLGVRSALVDAAESGAAAALAVQVVLPTSASALYQLGVTIGAAFLGAFLSNLRRKAQDALAKRSY